MTRLTEHFMLEELTESPTAVRLGIAMIPPPEIITRLSVVAQGLERVREWLGSQPIRVNSGWRPEALERVLCERDYRAWCLRHGFDVTSESWATYFKGKAHPQGWAVDWTCPSFGPVPRVLEAVRRSGIAFDQLIEEGATAAGGGWVHTSFDPRLRGQVLVAHFDQNGVPSYASI